MNLTKDKIKNAVMCAKQVLDQKEIFHGDPAKIAISVDAVADYIASQCGVTIEFREVVFEAAHLKGRKETWPGGRVVIDIRSDMSDAWKRFVALKELMHVLVDQDEDDLTPYGDVILEKLMLEGHIGVLSGNGDTPPAQSELVAEVAAIEVIYPISFRGEDRKAIKNPDSGITESKLALKYNAPSPIVGTALNDEYLGFIVAALQACLED